LPSIEGVAQRHKGDGQKVNSPQSTQKNSKKIYQKFQAVTTVVSSNSLALHSRVSHKTALQQTASGSLQLTSQEIPDKFLRNSMRHNTIESSITSAGHSRI
jgi:hypothetical protein